MFLLCRAAFGRRRAYDFTAPTVRPVTKYRWKNGYTHRMGRTEIIIAASWMESVVVELLDAAIWALTPLRFLLLLWLMTAIIK